jgi:putative FmdB family regulatory protein
MPTFDFKCSEGHYHEAIVKADDLPDCPTCGGATQKVFLAPPKIGWLRMAQGASAGPEFIDRFEKMHKDQKVKEEKFEREHGPGQYGNCDPGG